MIEQFSRASIAELYAHLSDFKNRKYALLHQYSDLERLRDIHPRRGSLLRVERRIWLLEEAIRSKELKSATEKLGGEQPTEVGAVMLPTATPAPAPPIYLPQPSPRQAGRKPNTDYNAKVAEILWDYPDWRDRLREVCEALDKRGVGLPQTKKAKGRGWTTWMDAFDEDPEWVRKALQHRATTQL
jgi:hypothetical protein